MATIVIIGAGECGVRAAFALREQGYAEAITLIGGEASLPYERPPLSKQGGREIKLIRQRQAYKDADIDLRLGLTVDAIHPDVRSLDLSSGETIQYKQLLLATGAEARLFPTMEGCLTLRTDADAKAILESIDKASRIGIIGGGFIGLELAAVARDAGAEVTVFESGLRVLARAVPAEIAEFVQARHKLEGVQFRTNCDVKSATDTTVTLSDNRVFDFDTVIAGVGSIPNTTLAQMAGLTLDNGILVDENFGTSDADIYAAGDCCSFKWRDQRVRLESWKAAQDQAAHVCASMLGEPSVYNKVPWFWSDQYDLTLQVTGLFDQKAVVHRRATIDGACLVFQCDRQGVLQAAAAVGIGHTMSKEVRVFEKLIERQAKIELNILSDATQNLKRLLKNY